MRTNLCYACIPCGVTSQVSVLSYIAPRPKHVHVHEQENTHTHSPREQHNALLAFLKTKTKNTKIRAWDKECENILVKENEKKKKCSCLKRETGILTLSTA